MWMSFTIAAIVTIGFIWWAERGIWDKPSVVSQIRKIKQEMAKEEHFFPLRPVAEKRPAVEKKSKYRSIDDEWVSS